MDEINYYLKENNLNTVGGKEYVAVVEKKKPVYQDELILKMVRKNTTVTRQDIIVVLDLFRETVVEQSLMRYPVHTDLFRTGISIKGGFRDINDRFDCKRHRVLLNMNSALPVQRAMNDESGRS